MAHHHHHHHDSHGDHDFAHANREFFNTDKGADMFKSEDAKIVAQKSVAAFLEAYKFDRETTDVLDFACGVGALSKRLASHAKSFFGIDISEKMVEEYNKMVKEEGLDGRARAIACDITKETPDDLKGLKVDVIICALSYHHFSSPKDITIALSRYLKPKGSILIIDLLDSPKPAGEAAQGSVPGKTIKDVAGHYVAHASFTEADMKDVFTSADMELREYKPAFEFSFGGMHAPTFITVGVKKE